MPVSLDDGDGGLGRGHVVLNADQMRMPNVRRAIMYSGDLMMRRLDAQGLGMRRRDGRLLLDVEHMVDLLSYIKRNAVRQARFKVPCVHKLKLIAA